MARNSTPPDEKTIGGRIQLVRGGLTQEEFAKQLGIGRTTLIRYENNERSPDATLLRDVALRFEVDPSWLLLGIGSAPERKHLSQEKQALLDAFDEMTPEQRRAILEVGKVLVQPKPNKFAG